MSALADIYRRAAEIIDERGWHQGWYSDPDGQRVCLLGACAVACGATFDPRNDQPCPEFDDSADHKRWFAAWDALTPFVAHLSAWNDAADRTAEDVKALLLEAAEKADRHG